MLTIAALFTGGSALMASSAAAAADAPVSVNVGFEANGSGFLALWQIREIGDLVDVPTVPSPKTGELLLGWFTEKDGGTEWDFATDTIQTEVLTLWAHWESLPVAVTFDMGGIGTQVEPWQGLAGEYAQYPTPPTAEGYIFDGWYAAAGPSDYFYFTKDTVITDMTAYAHWTQTATPEQPPVTEPPVTEPPVTVPVEPPVVLLPGDLPETDGPTVAPATPFATSAGVVASNRGSVTAVQQGSAVTISVPDAEPGDEVFVYGYSTPVPLGFFTVNAARQITVSSASFETGDHHFVVLSATGEVIGWAPVTVAPTSSTITEQELAATGVDSSAMTMGAIVLLALGMVLTALAIRRNGKGVTAL